MTPLVPRASVAAAVVDIVLPVQVQQVVQAVKV
jgi:hypothetical protein